MKKLFLLFSVLCVFSAAVCAGVPNKIKYNGRLKSYQTPVNGTVKMNFKLYNSESGSNLIWESGDRNIAVSSGIFTFVLEPQLDKKIDLRDGLYLELWVEDKKMEPREELMSQPYALYAANGVPPGTVIAFAGAAKPDGYLICDGNSYSTADYPELAETLKGLYGNPNTLGSTFKAPNFQGIFLRGEGAQQADYPNTASRTTYQSASLGVFQGDAIRNITGTMPGLTGTSDYYSGFAKKDGAFPQSGDRNTFYTTNPSYNWAFAKVSLAASNTVPTSNENRPANYAVKYCIKY